MFNVISKKRDDSVKARMCVDVSKRDMDKSEFLAPKISTDALLITLVVDADEGRDAATINIQGEFIQTVVKPGNYIKFTGAMVDILCELNTRLYTQYVVLDNGRKVLYMEAQKVVYGMVYSDLLFWLDLSGLLDKQGYVMNPYDICCMNKMINGAQCTIVWNVNDIKASHINTEVLT